MADKPKASRKPRANRKQKITPLQVMLVEDNPGDVYLFERTLRNRNIAYELSVYQNGAQAMRAIAESGFAAPDLILVDLNLPGRDGFDVLNTIHRSPHLAGVPTGVLTSSNTPKDRQFVALMGAKHIHKARNLDEYTVQVSSAVDELLALSPRRTQLARNGPPTGDSLSHGASQG